MEGCATGILIEIDTEDSNKKCTDTNSAVLYKWEENFFEGMTPSKYNRKSVYCPLDKKNMNCHVVGSRPMELNGYPLRTSNSTVLVETRPDKSSKNEDKEKPTEDPWRGIINCDGDSLLDNEEFDFSISLSDEISRIDDHVLSSQSESSVDGREAKYTGKKARKADGDRHSCRNLHKKRETFEDSVQNSLSEEVASFNLIDKPNASNKENDKLATPQGHSLVRQNTFTLSTNNASSSAEKQKGKANHSDKQDIHLKNSKSSIFVPHKKPSRKVTENRSSNSLEKQAKSARSSNSLEKQAKPARSSNSSEKQAKPARSSNSSERQAKPARSSNSSEKQAKPARSVSSEKQAKPVTTNQLGKKLPTKNTRPNVTKRILRESVLHNGNLHQSQASKKLDTTPTSNLTLNVSCNTSLQLKTGIKNRNSLASGKYLKQPEVKKPAPIKATLPIQQMTKSRLRPPLTYNASSKAEFKPSKGSNQNKAPRCFQLTTSSDSSLSFTPSRRSLNISLIPNLTSTPNRRSASNGNMSSTPSMRPFTKTPALPTPIRLLSSSDIKI